MGAPVQLACRVPAAGGGAAYTASVRGGWITIHGDLEDTAEAAGVLLRPLTYASAFVYPAKVHPAGTRVIIRCRYPQASTLTTSPIVQLWGIYTSEKATEPTSAGAFTDDGTVQAMRLDNIDQNNAGVTVTLLVASDARDTTYKYSDVTDLDGYDLKGCDYLLALASTAGNISAGPLELQALLLN